MPNLTEAARTRLLPWFPLLAALRVGASDPMIAMGGPNDDSRTIAAAADRPIVSHPYLYTILETALVLVAGEVWYLRNGTDDDRWGQALGWRSWKRKMEGNDVVFDGDRFHTNGIGHPIGGAAYYQIARGNGLGPGAAFISSVIASTVWEYFGELPEHPSINDLILTPTAGSVIGEASYQLGRRLARSGLGAVGCAGAMLFAPVATLNDRASCDAGPGSLPPLRLGMAMGVGRSVFDGRVVRDELALSLAADVVSQRAYGRPGRGVVIVGPGQFSGLYVNGRFGEGRVDGIWFNAQTVWAGRYYRDYRLIEDGTDTTGSTPVRGWGALLGFGSSFDYRMRDLPRERERIASVGLGGPTFEVSTRHGVLVRASLTVQYAFAMVDSLAYRESPEVLVAEEIKKSLRSGGYYYAHGVVSAARLTVELGPLEIMGDGRAAWYWSFDSGDAAQSTIDHNVSLRDSRLFLSAAMWSRPILARVRLGLGVEHIRRASYILDSGIARTETGVLAATAVGF